MKRDQYRAWCDKNERLNENHTLVVGDRVLDVLLGRRSGTVTYINDWSKNGPLTNENHGTVNVMLDTGEEEHYCLVNWKRHLRITNANSR